MSLLPCKDCFLMQREISQMRFICCAANQRRRGEPRLFSLSSIRYSLQLELLPKKEPNSLLWKTPQNSTCVKKSEQRWFTQTLFSFISSPSFKPWDQYICQADYIKDQHEMFWKSCPMDTNLLPWPLSWKNHGRDTFQQQRGKEGWYKDTSKPVNS